MICAVKTMRLGCVFGLLVLLLVALHSGLAGEPDAAVYRDHARLLFHFDEEGQKHPVRTPEQWVIRRRHILSGMQQAMGPLPDRSKLVPLDMQVVETVEGNSFRRLNIHFRTEGMDRLPALLYLPKSRGPKAGRPAMLALHPTSPLGKHRVSREGGVPNRAYAYELARRGYVVIAPDYPPFGDYAYDFETDDYVSGTMKGIFNHMRCVDLLQSRPGVDPNRIGVIGHSLGGHNAMFAAVFDPRLKVIVSSCGWTPFHDYYNGKIKGWTSDRYMPLLRTRYGLDPDRVPFDFYEVVAALAPRAFFSSSPLRDSNFDVRGVKKVEPEARRVYELLGVRDSLVIRYPDCEHDFPPEIRREAYTFIDRILNHSLE